MARAAKKKAAPRPSSTAGVQAAVITAKLEHRLVLLRWFLHTLGANDNRSLLDACARAEEGVDEEGVFHVTKILAAQVKDPAMRHALRRYDANVRRHLETINKGRAAQPLELRYFQVLALFFTELYLDRLAQAPGELLHALNRFLAKLPERALFQPFGRADLRKLAFWMATGSGKTLVLHFNLLQYRHYFPGPLNNIILITPNAGLSDQHLAEARASGLHAERFDPERPGLLPGRDVLQVIEITKLVEEKKGGGVTVPVACFLREGVPNLIFVDEGHKGSGGEVWKGYRDQLGATGFTFEYSATFGQALNAAGNDELLAEYGKAIAFDYSYRYFHGDGFGKDFRLLNVGSDEPATRDALMAANLLSYYQQLRVYANGTDWRPYGIEKPLWVYVGASVNSGKTGGSDIATVLGFLDRFLTNKGGWSAKLIKKLLHDESLFRGDDGRAGLHDALAWLRSRYPEGKDLSGLLADVAARVFNLSGEGARLEVQPIRGADGEIALRAQGAMQPFGLVNVGDTAALVKLLREQGLPVLEDVVGESLFAGLNRRESPVNVLVGAKKFIEGWSSWRVSSLGLLNVGRSEGAQIIQLFGRGVRLLGLGRSLKRSTALPGVDHPADIEWLEQLNVFSVRASYMQVFREALLREGVDDVASVMIELPLWQLARRDAAAENLPYFDVPAPHRFKAERVLLPSQPSGLPVRHDVSARFATYASTASGLAEGTAQRLRPRRLESASLALVDWNQAYFRLAEKKRLRGWSNAVIRPGSLRTIVEEGCEFIADDAFLRPTRSAGIARLQEAVCEALEAWFERDYRLQQKRFETQHMRVVKVGEAKSQYPTHQVLVRVDEASLIEELKRLAGELRKKREPDWANYPQLRRARFDNHLYQPLLVAIDSAAPDAVSISPKALEASERGFVEALRDYCQTERTGRLKGHSVYLLRNQSRGRGLGFYETEGFFPDFILWNVDSRRQQVVFVEPHGLLMERRGSDKLDGFQARLSKYLAGATKGKASPKLHVSGWVVSHTPISDLNQHWGTEWSEDDFEARGVLFPHSGYSRVLEKILK